MNSEGAYESVYSLVLKCVDPDKPSLKKSLPNWRSMLDNKFIQLGTDWRAYKEDTGLSNDDFNSVTDGVPAIKHNDRWYDDMECKYMELCVKADELLTLDSTSVDKDQSEVVASGSERKLVEILLAQIEAECKNIEDETNTLTTEVNNAAKGSIENQEAESLIVKCTNLADRLNHGLQDLVLKCLPLLDDTDLKEKTDMNNSFVSRHRQLLSNLSSQIVAKSVGKIPPSSSHKVEHNREHTYLKKIDPPKFDGEITYYPDFKRKWKANVGNANLTAEGELDRLKENVPAQAAKLLYSETNMANAWKVLDSMYGNKSMIANKLKNQLKEIQPNGKEDYDIVINLAIDVKSIQNRLEELNLESMLKYDAEYLSAVFQALPTSERLEWLKYDKEGYDFEWDALVSFLEQAREKASSTKVLLSCYSSPSDRHVTCTKCGNNGHKKSACTVRINALDTKGVNSGESSDDDEAEKLRQERDKEIKKRVREQCGKCPLCKKRHTFLRKRDNKDWPSDRFISCPQFHRLSVVERASLLERESGCARCTAWSHTKIDCRAPTFKCGQNRNGNICQADHSRLVCGSGLAYCGSLAVSSASPSLSSLNINGETLLAFQEVEVVGASKYQLCCFDNGSNRCLVQNKFARENKFQSQKVQYRLKTVGREEEIREADIFMFDVRDNSGHRTRIWAYGIDHIMNPPDSVDLRSIEHLFPHVPHEAFTRQSSKDVTLLIGNNFLSLHPSGGQGRNAVGNLRALQSSFGKGWVICGAHPLLDSSIPQLSVKAAAVARVNRCEVSPVIGTSFWAGENMGVLAKKRCLRCQNCVKCTDEGLLISRQDQEDLDLLKSGVRLENGEVHVSYHFKKDPKSLPNNRHVALKIAEKLEQRLISEGLYEFYNSEMAKYFERGGAVSLSEEELNSWQGGINYISHHGVLQDSATTPLRIVTNSSLKNGGKSLNDCLIAGPNSLNSMFDIMLRFRCYECALVFDLTKAYNALRTGLVERHLRRFIWRFSPDEPWQDFAFDRVAFGDVPAANLLEISRNLLAENGRDIDPVAANRLINDSYVDDGVTGGSYQEVVRMKGERLEDGRYSGTLGQILDRGNFRMKAVITTGEVDEDIKSLINNKVLGYGWNSTSDVMAINFPINITKKKTKKLRSGPCLTREDLHKLPDTVLTRRICLGITNSFPDFLGLACPLTVRFK